MSVLKQLNQRPIAYYPIYRQLTGATTSGLLLSQCMYWFSKQDEFYKTDKEIMTETLLTENELRSAKKNITILDFITVTKRGIPAKTYYKIDWSLYETSLINFTKQEELNPQSKFSEINETIGVKSTKLKSLNPQDSSGEIHETNIVKSFNRDYTETTAENTAENKIKNKINPPVIQEPKPPVVGINPATRICNYFDRKKQKLQPNFMRNENDAEYLIKQALEAGRTLEQFKDAIDYLFSGRETMAFWVKTINNIASLIKHFNAIEADSIAETRSPKVLEMNETTKAYANVLRKKGMSDDEVLEKLKSEGFVAS